MAGAIGDIFRERRLMLGLTLEHVALVAGVSPMKMRSIENGRDRAIGTKGLQALLDTYGLAIAVSDRHERPRILGEEFYRQCQECGRMRMIGTLCKDPRTGQCDNDPNYFL